MKVIGMQMMRLVLCSVATLSLSCSKQVPSLCDLSPSSDEDVSEDAVADRLVFDSHQSFEESILTKRLCDDKGNRLKLSAFDFSETRASGDGASCVDFSDLVPEEDFAKLLNRNGEVQVGDTIYRVTPEGTFYVSVREYPQLELVLKDSLWLSEHEVSPHLYKVGDVYRYDTFGSVFSGNDSPSLNGRITASETGHTYNPQSVEMRAFNHEGPAIDSFESVPGRRHTWVGKLFQGVGVRYSHTIHLGNSSKFRLNCALFDYNYVIHQAIGVSGKIEHKMWYGGWAKVQEWSEGDLMVGHRWMILRFPWGPGMKFKETYDTIYKDMGMVPFHPRNNQDYIFAKNLLGGDLRINTDFYPLLNKSNPDLSDIVYCGEVYMKEVAKKYTKETGRILPFHLSDPYHIDLSNTPIGVQLSQLLNYFGCTVPVFGKDGIYIVYGPVYNTNMMRENAITLKPIHKGISGFKFSFGIPIGDNGSVDDVFKSIKVSDVLNEDVALVAGDFYACGYLDGKWKGYRLYW